MLSGLYIGRFQPFHLGHLSAIQQALKQVERLYIGIGSSQYHDTAENPFTAEERVEMIELALREVGIEKQVEIFLIPDIHDAGKWVEHVKSITPPFDVVFVGNEGLVKTLFEEAKIKVVKVEQEVDVSATEIRNSMQKNEEWEKMVSPKAIHYLTSIEGRERIKRLKSL